MNCGSTHYAKKIANILKKSSVSSHILDLAFQNSTEMTSQLISCKPSGIIITGSPDHLYLPTARILSTLFAKFIVDTRTPTLGICYGHQMLAALFGGVIIKNPKGLEIGPLKINFQKPDFPLFNGLQDKFLAVMMHYDVVTMLPSYFHNYANTTRTENVAIQYFENNDAFPIFGVQFHPEMSRKNVYNRIFRNFLGFCH
jgi:GMP synthase (glutamine-hydrolysing)